MYPNPSALRSTAPGAFHLADALTDFKRTHEDIGLADVFYTLADANVEGFEAATQVVRSLSRDLSTVKAQSE